MDRERTARYDAVDFTRPDDLMGRRWDPQIGLVVEHRAYHSEEWQDYWQLYCLQRLGVGDRQKLYESEYVSLVIGPTGSHGSPKASPFPAG